MNPSTVIFLINDTVKAVAVEYEPKGNTTLLKTMDPSIKVGDFVVCQSSTRHEMTTAKVVEVDVDIDLESTVTVPWLISVIDVDGFNSLLAKEAEAVATIKAAQDRKKKAELRAALSADKDEQVLALDLNTVDGKVIEPPAAPE